MVAHEKKKQSMNRILCNLVRLGQANSVNPTNKIETIYFSLTDVKPVLTKMAATSKATCLPSDFHLPRCLLVHLI